MIPKKGSVKYKIQMVNIKSIILQTITPNCLFNPFNILSKTLSVYINKTIGDKIFIYLAHSKLLNTNKLILSASK